MRVVRFVAGDETKYGVLDGNIIHSLQHSPFDSFRDGIFQPNFDNNSYDLNSVKLLAPCLPSKLVCLGINYHSHAIETGLPIPPVPLIFLKPSTAVIGPEDKIVLPRLDKRRVDYEAELAIVIGKRAKNISKEQAKEYVLGYTCFNDVSERYAQKADVQWTRCKGYDTFAPIGPWIETEVNPDDLKIEAYLNGELRQSARTSDLIFSVPEIISFVSSIMTLLPGDVIGTGTPSGIGKMDPGDIIEIRIESIGTLKNFVVDHTQEA